MSCRGFSPLSNDDGHGVAIAIAKACACSARIINPLVDNEAVGRDGGKLKDALACSAIVLVRAAIEASEAKENESEEPRGRLGRAGSETTARLYSRMERELARSSSPGE